MQISNPVTLQRGVWLVLLLGLCFLLIQPVKAGDMQVIGWVEYVGINGLDMQVKAKIDTGATVSSINAKILKSYEKDGKQWVKFQIKNNKGDERIIDKEVIREVFIKRKGAEPLKRPVVYLDICLGSIYKEAEINLSSRDNFVYEVLIGRNYLMGDFLVDSNNTFTVKPSCENRYGH